MSNYLNTTHRDIAWFKQSFELNQLEMRPPFQRNPVWTQKQKSFLMDSILNGYPIPEIYMQDLVDEEGNKKYIVVDGQQRITACLEFITNQYVINGKDSPQFSDLSFDDLNGEQKKQVYRYQFVIRSLPEISDFELREIFQRLNRNNVALNQQELRQATYWGPFIKTMNEIADWDIWKKIDVFSSNDIKRMADVEFISELSIAILHGLQNKKLTLDKYYQLYEEDFPEQNRLKENFDAVLREIVYTLPTIGDTRWSKKTDFYSFFLLLAKYRGYLPMNESKRQILRERLMMFGQQIDSFLSVDAENQGYVADTVRNYALNVRASSDLGARRKREDALEAELAPIILSETIMLLPQALSEPSEE